MTRSSSWLSPVADICVQAAHALGSDIGENVPKRGMTHKGVRGSSPLGPTCSATLGCYSNCGLLLLTRYRFSSA
jgi:hypothetical protein